MFYGNACGIPKLEAMVSFVECLHDLGRILYYRANPLLNDYIVLDPSWLAGLVAPLFSWKVRAIFLKNNELFKKKMRTGIFLITHM